MRRISAITFVSLAAIAGIAFVTHAIRTHVTDARFTFAATSARQGALHLPSPSGSANVTRGGAVLGATALRSAGKPRGNRSRRRLTRTVRRLRSRRFELSVDPARRTLPAGASTTYKARIARTAGFRQPVTLRVLRLGPGATATWRRTTLTLATRAGQRPRLDRFVIEATSRIGGRTVRRRAAVALRIVASRPFSIRADLTTPLYPGRRAPLDLLLTNPYPFAIRVAELSVRVGEHTTKPHCSGGANYAAAQYSGRYPLVLRPGSTRLSALVSESSAWPQLVMHDLPSNQDACKGAALSLHYGGLASR